jgi:hypothetical protein
VQRLTEIRFANSFGVISLWFVTAKFSLRLKMAVKLAKVKSKLEMGKKPVYAAFGRFEEEYV